MAKQQAEQQKLIMHHVYSDGYSGCETQMLPFRYESVAKAKADFQNLIAQAYFAEGKCEVEFAGHTFQVREFIHDETVCLPNFHTLDAWFDLFSGKQ